MKRKIKIPVWKGYPDGKPVRMLEVLESPYAKNGWITPEGYFIEVPAGGHIRWAHDFDTKETLLEEAGWLQVWNFESMFVKNPKIRWDSNNKIIHAQYDTILMWCSSNKMKPKDALSYLYDDFVTKTGYEE